MWWNAQAVLRCVVTPLRVKEEKQDGDGEVPEKEENEVLEMSKWIFHQGLGFEHLKQLKCPSRLSENR
jgi:hypothetical protein